MNKKIAPKYRRRRSKLDPHQHLIISSHKSGKSLERIQLSLSLLGVEVKSRTTIKNFIDSRLSMIKQNEEFLLDV